MSKRSSSGKRPGNRVGIDKRSARRAPGPGSLTILYRAGLDCSCAGRTGRGSPPGERDAASDSAKSPGLPLRLGGRLAARGSPKLQNQAPAGWPGRRRGDAPRRLVPVPPGVFFCTTSATANLTRPRRFQIAAGDLQHRFTPSHTVPSRDENPVSATPFILPT